MKSIFLCLIILSWTAFSAQSFAKAKIDTIDNWQVYYNNRIIATFPFPGKSPIVIKKNLIKPNDFLKIQYDNDTPCSDCTTGLYILDKNKKTIIVNGRGTFSALKVTIKEVLKYANQNHTNVLDFYYYDDYKRDTFIFKLKFE